MTEEPEVEEAAEDNGHRHDVVIALDGAEMAETQILDESDIDTLEEEAELELEADEAADGCRDCNDPSIEPLAAIETDDNTDPGSDCLDLKPKLGDADLELEAGGLVLAAIFPPFCACCPYA